MAHKPDVIGSELSKAIAETVGDVSLSSLVDDIIDISQRGLYIFHGLKRACHVEGVAKQGVFPLTPEGSKQGCVSFWTAHRRFFTSALDPDSAILTYDTGFFHYGHLYSESRSTKTMGVAVASVGELATRSGISISPDAFRRGYIETSHVVPQN